MTNSDTPNNYTYEVNQIIQGDHMKNKITVLSGLTIILASMLVGCSNTSQPSQESTSPTKTEKKTKHSESDDKTPVQDGYSYKNNVLKIDTGSSSMTYKFTDAAVLPSPGGAHDNHMVIYYDAKNNSDSTDSTASLIRSLFPWQASRKNFDIASIDMHELQGGDSNPAIQKVNDIVSLGNGDIKPKATIHSAFLVNVYSLRKPFELKFRDGFGTIFGTKKYDLSKLKTVEDDSGDNVSFDTSDGSGGDQSATYTKGFSYSNDVLNLQYNKDESASFKFTGAAKVPESDKQMVIYYDVTNTSKRSFRYPSLELYTQYGQNDASNGIGYQHGDRIIGTSDADERLQKLIDKQMDDIEPGETVHTGVMITYTDNGNPVVMTFKNDKDRLIGRRTIDTSNLQDAQ